MLKSYTLGFRYIVIAFNSLSKTEKENFSFFLHLLKNENCYHIFKIMLLYNNHWNDPAFRREQLPLSRLKQAINNGNFLEALIWTTTASKYYNEYLSIPIQNKIHAIEKKYKQNILKRNPNERRIY